MDKTLYRRPTKQEILNAKNSFVSDVIKSGLSVLFCGINPGLYTAAVGHHFGRPGNRFWKALYMSGFTPRLFHPSEQEQLLDLGYGITNIVNRATASAADLSQEELKHGRTILEEKVRKYKPQWMAILGVQAYRVSFDDPGAKIGPQAKKIDRTRLWVLPNPSGLNAHYSPSMLAEEFGNLKHVVIAK